MKTCSKCKNKKNESDFYPDKNKRLRSECKTCSSEASKRQRQQPGYKEKKRESNRRSYLKNKDKVLTRSKRRRRKDHLRYKFGLTENQVSQLVASQQSMCKICGDEFSSTQNTHIDHCHTTNKVRGILCSNCNLGLGHFKDSPERLRQAANYLEETNV